MDWSWFLPDLSVNGGSTVAAQSPTTCRRNGEWWRRMSRLSDALSCRLWAVTRRVPPCGGNARIIRFAGSLGEVFAVLALYDGSDNSANRLIVLLATIALLLAVTAVPVAALLRLATSLTVIARAPLESRLGPDESPSAEPGEMDPGVDEN